MIDFEDDELTIAPNSFETMKINVQVPVSAAPGIYTGDIVVEIDDEEYLTPITIKVEIPGEPLLDVLVEVLTPEIAPGNELKFRVTLKNMGETATIEDVVTSYGVFKMENEELLLTSSETYAVDDILSFTKSMLIPNNTVEGRYIIEINASYWNDNKIAGAAAAFDVRQLPLFIILLGAGFFLIWMLLPIAYFGIRWWKKHKLKKAAGARYIFPTNFNKLPKEGPSTIRVGRVAESDKFAYTDVHNLMMHSIAAGGTGSGKSVSAMVTVEELLKRKLPVIVFDPTAQWTAFIKACKDKHMLDLYPKFGLKPSDARSFKTNLYMVDDVNKHPDIRDHLKPGEITVFIMSKLKPSQMDTYVRGVIAKIFDAELPESPDLKVLLIFDEIHRLLAKYGGKGGFVALERGAREFRKWGVGLFLISQVLSDFKGAIRANIATEIQLRTKYGGDINRVKVKYGTDYAGRIPRLTIGTGLVHNPEFNDGKPWFVNFRPLLHDTGRMTQIELDAYFKVRDAIADVDSKLKDMKKAGKDTYDIELELNMAKDKLKQGMFKMAQTYLDGVKNRLKKMGV